MTKNRAQTNAIFELILAETKNKSALNVLELCELAGVSRSGYYRWIAAADKRIAREAADYADFLLIQKLIISGVTRKVQEGFACD